MAASDSLDECLVVPSDSVHRIQEAQDALAHGLWSAVQRWWGTPVGAEERSREEKERSREEVSAP